MRNPKVGLLPLYLELYDRTDPQIRPAIDACRMKVANALKAQGMEVIHVPVCRIEPEFREAVREFEKQDADAIVTLHLAYSPSLESEKALAETKLPIIVLDTTPDYYYDQFTSPDALMMNHGIHGVQDMCNRLIRNGKKFQIFAGHLDHSDVLQQVCASARCAMVVHELRRARVGLVGRPFDGMGDFQLPYEEMKRDLGIETVHYDFEKGGRRHEEITAEQIEAEWNADCEKFDMDPALTREVYDRSARTCLAIRKWAEEERLTGFSINFLATDGAPKGLPIMPFVECCKAMERGLGYAGEGDVLTAALMGALCSAFDEVTFTEMFCPDWAHDNVFLSHMGEVNYAIGTGKPRMKEVPFAETSAENPTAAYQNMKGGDAVFVNLAPFGGGKYTLTLAPGQMQSIRGENLQADSNNGWFKPRVSLPEFLTRFSKAGGTHHSVLVYGDVLDQLIPLADYLGCRLEVIQ